MSAASTPGAQALCNDIAAFIADSRALLARGALMELAGLDKRVAYLCKTVLNLPDAERQLFAARLKELMDELSMLEADLSARRDTVARQLGQVPQHKKASTAYRIVDASDGYKEE